MSDIQLVDFLSCVVSIILSHQYQKEDILKIINGTAVDFTLVRETMYKYSKKAELRFFKNPYLAFCLVKFGTSKNCRSHIWTKFSKTNPNQSSEKQIDLRNRTFEEIEQMKDEGLKLLKNMFAGDVKASSSYDQILCQTSFLLLCHLGHEKYC